MATGNWWYAALAYDSLIYKAPDGSLQPQLAESWSFVDDDNKVFELRLRSNVKFSDGSELTAEVVKANIERYRNSADLTASSELARVTSVRVVDPLTVRLVSAKPDPVLPMRLTAEFSAGHMVSEAGLKEPKKLATQTFGAGPYVLDSAETVADDHYTYKPNPNYWNKSEIHYDKIVLKVLPNPNSGLSALKTGQVDIFGGEPELDQAAKSAGLDTVAIPQTWAGLALADRAGKVLPALGDVRVRQALNYAVDRKKIAEGLVGTYGGPVPTQQIVLPGQVGHNDRDFYSYDPDRAKQLLSQAGYPDGFTLPVASHSRVTPLLEVMEDQLKAVGVRLKITDAGANQEKWAEDVLSEKFPAFGMNFGTHPSLLLSPRALLLSEDATVFNPFGTTDPQIESLFQLAASAEPGEREQLEQQIVKRVIDQGWFVPVLFKPVSFYSRPSVSGIKATAGRPIPNIVEFHLSEAS